MEEALRATLTPTVVTALIQPLTSLVAMVAAQEALALLPQEVAATAATPEAVVVVAAQVTA